MKNNPCAEQEAELFDAFDEWNKVAFKLGLPKPRRNTTQDTQGLNLEYQAAQKRYAKAEAKLAECKKAHGLEGEGKG